VCGNGLETLSTRWWDLRELPLPACLRNWSGETCSCWATLQQAELLLKPLARVQAWATLSLKFAHSVGPMCWQKSSPPSLGLPGCRPHGPVALGPGHLQNEELASKKLHKPLGPTTLGPERHPPACLAAMRWKPVTNGQQFVM
jgi:hypothetical protein